ncbi:MAG: aromatic ring-hydroxylating oxygenase subunit alpha, partial [Paracoccaceae bacterium]
MTNAFTSTESRIVNGVKRTMAPTYQEIRAQDQVPGPDEYFGEAPGKAFCGEAFSVPNSFYFSEEQAQKEAEKLWPNVWRFAGRIEKLPTVGSVFVHDLLDDSILIVRASETELRAFRNTCPHRGNQLRKPGSCGVINKFFCPYHGATWNLDGTTDKWPFPYEFSHFEEGKPGRDLNEVAVEVFDGFIF